MYVIILIVILAISFILSIIHIVTPSHSTSPSHSPSPSPSPSPGTITIDTRIKWGIAVGRNLKYNKQTISLTKFIEDIDIFWDWESNFSDNLYNISYEQAKKNSQNYNVLSKYIPMLWAPTKQNIHTLINYLKDIKSITQDNNKTKYLLGWNEPDMTGTILGNPVTGQWDTGASSAGFWTTLPSPDENTFIYGNYNKTDITDINKVNYNNTTFKQLAIKLGEELDLIKTTIPNIKITTPVTANGPIISNKYKCVSIKPQISGQQVCSAGINPYKVMQPCGAIYGGDSPINTRQLCANTCGLQDNDKMCNGFPLVKSTSISQVQPIYSQNQCYNQCGTSDNPQQECRCNGWLDLIKKSNPQSDYWNSVDIINIHGYHYKAHMIKLRILLTIAVFQDDVKKGKKIWLTETACIYKPEIICQNNNNQSKGVKENIIYVNELFWLETDATLTLIKDCASDIITNINALVHSESNINLNTKLPGLRSSTKFNFNGQYGSWYDHGFEAITYFSACIPGWSENCFLDGIDPSMSVDSRIFDENDNLNNIWDALKSPPSN